MKRFLKNFISKQFTLLPPMLRAIMRVEVCKSCTFESNKLYLFSIGKLIKITGPNP